MKNTNAKILAWAATFALLGLVLVYVFEIQRFENTMGVNDMVWKSLAVGLTAGIFAGWRLACKGKEQVARLQIWATCLLGCLVFAPLFCSLANRLLSPHEPTLKQVEFFQEKPFFASRFGMLAGEKITPSGYYLFFSNQGKLERIKTKEQHFQGIQRGDTIEIWIKKGLFGYELVLMK